MIAFVFPADFKGHYLYSYIYSLIPLSSADTPVHLFGVVAFNADLTYN